MLVNVYTHSLFDDLLGKGATVLDLGANVGKFSENMVERYGCRCVAVEPSLEAMSQITPHTLIEPVNLAVDGEAGTVLLNLATNSEANSIGKATGFDYVDQIAVKAITLDDALALTGEDKVELLKLDIEGSEIDVFLKSAPETLRRFGQITVEFHDFCDITPRETVMRAVDKVKAAGFYVFYFDRHLYRYADVLFVNKTLMTSLRYFIEASKWWLPRMIAASFRRLGAAR